MGSQSSAMSQPTGLKKGVVFGLSAAAGGLVGGGLGGWLYFGVDRILPGAGCGLAEALVAGLVAGLLAKDTGFVIIAACGGGAVGAKGDLASTLVVCLGSGLFCGLLGRVLVVLRQEKPAGTAGQAGSGTEGDPLPNQAACTTGHGMYGVPGDLDLRLFVGTFLTQVCIGRYDLPFHFAHMNASLAVWGGWELRDAAGRLLDGAVEDPDNRECYRLHRLLGATVIGSRLDPPRSFTLSFDNGLSLTVFDDSEQHESFSIQPGNIVV